MMRSDFERLAVCSCRYGGVRRVSSRCVSRNSFVRVRHFMDSVRQVPSAIREQSLFRNVFVFKGNPNECNSNSQRMSKREDRSCFFVLSCFMAFCEGELTAWVDEKITNSSSFGSNLIRLRSKRRQLYGGAKHARKNFVSSLPSV